MYTSVIVQECSKANSFISQAQSKTGIYYHDYEMCLHIALEWDTHSSKLKNLFLRNEALNVFRPNATKVYSAKKKQKVW